MDMDHKGIYKLFYTLTITNVATKQSL